MEDNYFSQSLDLLKSAPDSELLGDIPWSEVEGILSPTGGLVQSSNDVRRRCEEIARRYSVVIEAIKRDLEISTSHGGEWARVRSTLDSVVNATRLIRGDNLGLEGEVGRLRSRYFSRSIEELKKESHGWTLGIGISASLGVLLGVGGGLGLCSEIGGGSRVSGFAFGYWSAGVQLDISVEGLVLVSQRPPSQVAGEFIGFVISGGAGPHASVTVALDPGGRFKFLGIGAGIGAGVRFAFVKGKLL